MVWTCRAHHRLDCRSTQTECGCTEKIWQAKEIMGWSAWEWQKEARYGFCWPSESFWVERTPSRKTCQKAQPSVEENRALNMMMMMMILDCQNPDFFSIFQLPFFAEPYQSNLCSPMPWLDYWAKTRYRPILRHCLGAVLGYLAIFYENLH